MRTLYLSCLFVIACLSLFGQGKAVIETAPAWVTPVSFNADAKPDPEDEGGYYCLLVDEQEHIARSESYYHVAYKILNAEGVQAMSDLSFSFDPVYQQLKVHHIKIHRNGAVMDKMPASISTIQREASMDYKLYDGTLTGIVHVPDVRVGDVIEYAFTVVGRNPVYDGHFAKRVTFTYPESYEKLFSRLIASEDHRLRFAEKNTDLKPAIRDTPEGREYTWELDRIDAVLGDYNTPYWYVGHQYTSISDFREWDEVAAWGSRHFSVSNAERASLRKALEGKFDASDQGSFALDAIRFVQDEIRYLGLMSGLSSHKPHSPVQVLENRFGDCKDKSLLLCSILALADIKASPVLVNTSLRGRIENELPSINAFDHCVVRYEIGNSVRYVDPTINYQGGRLEEINFPPYGKGLVLGEDSEGLADLQQTHAADITENTTIRVPSLDGEAYLQVNTTYTGGEADNMRRMFMNSSTSAIQKNYLTYYGNVFPGIEATDPIAYRDDRLRNTFIIEENYRVPKFWNALPSDTVVRYVELYSATLRDYFSITKSPRSSPYALTYPFSFHHSVEIELPMDWNATPDEAFIDNDYYHYEYYLRPLGNTIAIETHYRTKEDHVPQTAFETFVSDHDRMLANLAYQISFNSLVSVEPGISWLGVLSAIVAVVFSIWLMLRVYYYYDPKPVGTASDFGEPIGGWLILAAVGAVLNPPILLFNLWQSTDVYDHQMWANLFVLKRYAILGYVLLDHMSRFVLLAFSVLVLILFIRRRSSLPRLMIIYLAAVYALLFIDRMVGAMIDPNMAAEAGYYTPLVTGFISSAIWIPYFIYSSRVKDTFVVRIDEDDDGPTASVAYLQDETALRR